MMDIAYWFFNCLSVVSVVLQIARTIICNKKKKRIDLN